MNTTITFKVDKAIKAKAQETAKKMGIPLSSLINAYLRDVAATGRVEFTASEQMTPQMERITEGFIKEIKQGKTAGPFDTIEKAENFLDTLTEDDAKHKN